MSDSNQCSRDEWPIKAYKDLNFLNSEEARNIRVLCEMTEPGLRFAEEKIKDTIVLFGSARIMPIAEAQAILEAAQAGISDPDNPTADEKRALHLAQSAVKAAPYYQMAVELAEELTKWSMSLPAERSAIGSSSAPAVAPASWKPPIAARIMRAANRSASASACPSSKA